MIKIVGDRCNGCGACVSVCPAGALSLLNGKVKIEQDLCQGCGLCISNCPQGAIQELEDSSALVPSDAGKIRKEEPITAEAAYTSAPIKRSGSERFINSLSHFLESIVIPAISIFHDNQKGQSHYPRKQRDELNHSGRQQRIRYRRRGK